MCCCSNYDGYEFESHIGIYKCIYMKIFDWMNLLYTNKPKPADHMINDKGKVILIVESYEERQLVLDFISKFNDIQEFNLKVNSQLNNNNTNAVQEPKNGEDNKPNGVWLFERVFKDHFRF